jgi:hypothetical protein
MLPDSVRNAVPFRQTRGLGASYHHVANKGELLSAATEAVLAPAMAAGAADGAREEDAIRAVALAVFAASSSSPVSTSSSPAYACSGAVP